MSTSEVLTLLLVVFAALSYIDNHNNKKNSIPPPKSEGCYSLTYLTEGKSEIASDQLLTRL